MTRPPVAVVAAVLAFGLAFAPGSVALGERRASVTREVDCGILLPGILPEGETVKTTGLLTIEPSGTATLVCHGQLNGAQIALAPTEAVVLTDVDCALGNAGQVAESRTVVRPNGGVTLTCHFNPGSEPFIPGED